MIVAFNASGAFAGNANTNSQAIAQPAATLIDDILIACVLTKATGNTISAPDATWTEIYQEANVANTANDRFRASIWWKRATTAGASNHTFTKATDDNTLFGGAIMAYSGCKKRTSPIDSTAVGATVTTGATENVSFPAFDPTNVRAEIVYVAFYGNDLTTFATDMTGNTNPQCTKRLDVESSSGSDCSIAATSGATTDGSAISSRTWASASTTDAANTGVVFGLVPEARKFIMHY